LLGECRTPTEDWWSPDEEGARQKEGRPDLKRKQKRKEVKRKAVRKEENSFGRDLSDWSVLTRTEGGNLI
jgi:hypothetical protein